MSEVPTTSPPNAGITGQLDDVLAVLLTSLQSNVGRYVAFILTPILLPLVGAAAYWLQNVVGIDMQDHVAAVTAFIVATVGGLAGVIITWLRNRGLHETAAAETVNAALAARATVGAVSPPVSPDRSF
jgi:cell division inhibitor SulA